MSERLTLQDIKDKHGKEPDLMLVSDIETLESSKAGDNVADMYAIFYCKVALGGCIVYGKFGEADRSWLANPNLSHVVNRLTDLVIKNSK